MSTKSAYAALYEAGVKLLSASGVPEAALEARLLLEHVCGTRHHDLLAHGDRVVTEEEEKQYRELLNKRAERIPLAYLTGTGDFMGLTFKTDERALIPRADTETLVEAAMKQLFDGMTMLDLCTGTGCVALSLLNYSNDTRAVATDISKDALSLAKENAEILGLSERIRLECSDLFPPAGEDNERYDIITANPPYVTAAEMETLAPEVREHEPRIALTDGGDGLSFYRRIAKEAPGYLVRGGWLFVETGSLQGGAVSGILTEAGFKEVGCIKDLGGLDRVVCGTWWQN